MTFDLDYLFERKFFSNIDYYFAVTMAEIFNEKDIIAVLSCALVSKALSEGHICLDIKKKAKTSEHISKKSDEHITYPDFDKWIDSLQKSDIVSAPDLELKTPLILDSGQRLYFARYYDFQMRLVENIAQRVNCKIVINK